MKVDRFAYIDSEKSVMFRASEVDVSIFVDCAEVTLIDTGEGRFIQVKRNSGSIFKVSVPCTSQKFMYFLHTEGVDASMRIHEDTVIAVERDEFVSHPDHYNQVPDIECIDVIQWFSHNTGAAMKYLWRHEHKKNPVEDLKKAIKYIEFEIKKLESME